MKKLILIIIILISCGTGVMAQKKVALDSAGNYIQVSSKGDSTVDKATGKFFVDSKGVKYPVRISVNGNLYYLKTAKSGNVYKVYLKTK
jgi:hypothetical protein